jgi:pyruvate dehydrogenase E2 component (dihydrolipoamide acetyltransferase)
LKEIRFVDVGEGITEGHVQKWLVKDGDMVKEDQPVVQVETDKAVVNAPSPISGKIKINVPENSTVHVGDTLAYIGTESELSNIKQQAARPVQVSAPAVQRAPEKSAPAQRQARPQEITATPSVRKLARDNNVDISKIMGTGPGGRVTENDIMSFAGKAPPIQQNQAPKFPEGLEAKHAGEIERVPMSQTRKAIAKNLELSLSIPTFTHMDLINATNLYNTVKREKPNLEKQGVKLTFLPFIIKATVQALKENPTANASYDRDRQEIVEKKYYNIGLAAQAPDGLKVIVIKDADKKSIIQMAKEIQALHEKINDMTITIDEMRDTTFTITNVGSVGRGFLSVPIINPPDVGILGVSMIRDQPIVNEKGEIVAAKIMPYSLVFDHRVVDGADAVKFGATLVKCLEDQKFLVIDG